jgi:hypothetical protein
MTVRQAPPEEVCAKEVPAREVPTLQSYSDTFLTNDAASHKPSEQRAKRWILEARLIPALGHRRLDAILQEQVDEFVAKSSRAACRGRRLKIGSPS